MFIEIFMFIYCSIVSGLLAYYMKKEYGLSLEIISIKEENLNLRLKAKKLAKERMDYIMAKTANKMDRMDTIHQWRASPDYDPKWEAQVMKNVQNTPKLPEER